MKKYILIVIFSLLSLLASEATELSFADTRDA